MELAHSSTPMTLREWLAREPFTLVMSSGFFGFFAHAGVMTVLDESGLVPARVAGSSAGALVTGLWASGMSGAQIGYELTHLVRRDFWDPAFGPGLLRGKLFRQQLQALMPVNTFAQCRVSLAVSAFDVRSRQTHVLDQGELAPAIQASCAVPLLFHPVPHAGRTLLDGGVLDRPGLAGVPHGGRVFYHHLASRSPWRTQRGLRIPQRPQLVAMVIDELPRSGPFRLEAGARALELAVSATRRALDASIHDNLVRAS